jgi:hypothetical protein
VFHRGLFLCIPAAGLLALVPAAGSADAGATLTVPDQVQASQNAAAVVQPTFSYPEATPFCTVGVDFTWDGASWLSEFPTKNGGLCVAGGVNANAPADHTGAGSHQVCGSAGPRYSVCKTISVIITAATAPAATARPALSPAQAGAPGATAAAAQVGQAVPAGGAARAPTGVAAAVDDLTQRWVLGAAPLALGILVLAAIAGRWVILRRRKKATALPSPQVRR